MVDSNQNKFLRLKRENDRLNSDLHTMIKRYKKLSKNYKRLDKENQKLKKEIRELKKE